MYRAPLKEIRFVLHELLDDSQLSQLPGLSEYSPELADSVLAGAATFAEEILEPINRIGDRQGARWTSGGVIMPTEFKTAYAKFVEAGWSQLRASADHGGHSAPAVLGTAVEELWASSNLAFKLCPMLTQAAIEAVERCGSEEQKRTYLPRMISGEWTGTMNLTEPQAGSDLGAIRTRAISDGAHYRLFGQKIFITYGDHDLTPNIVHLVLARIEGAPPGTKGISLFIVPKVLINGDGTLGAPNDVRCISIEHKLGIHGSPTCTLTYGDRAGAIGYLVGEPNRGLEYMFIMMNAARLSVGLEGYALSERAYQQALEFARNRIQGRPAGASSAVDGKRMPIAYHPDVKRMLLTMKSYTDAARALALYGALQLDIAEHTSDETARTAAQTRGELLVPIIKGWSTESGVQLTSLGIQVHGGMGYIEETGAAQFLRDARITSIYEGTTGIQANDLLGRKVLRDNGAAIVAFIADMEADLEQIVSTDVSICENKSAALEAVGQLRNATATLLERAPAGHERVQAIAVPYLMLCGITAGGWLVTRAHVLAWRKADADPEFYAAKRQTARFYASHILPEALALARVVVSGTDAVREADPSLM
jgi:alkylation response protein AidB-like acyl-CoA dehydrogenase